MIRRRYRHLCHCHCHCHSHKTLAAVINDDDVNDENPYLRQSSRARFSYFSPSTKSSSSSCAYAPASLNSAFRYSVLWLCLDSIGLWCACSPACLYRLWSQQASECYSCCSPYNHHGTGTATERPAQSLCVCDAHPCMRVSYSMYLCVCSVHLHTQITLNDGVDLVRVSLFCDVDVTSFVTTRVYIFCFKEMKKSNFLNFVFFSIFVVFGF